MQQYVNKGLAVPKRNKISACEVLDNLLRSLDAMFLCGGTANNSKTYTVFL